MSHPTISAVMLTCNDAYRLRPCLESVTWADEVIVVDMHSEDDTEEICREYTDKIYYHERLRAPDPARNYLISLATSDWILMVDPDERITEPLRVALQNAAAQDHIKVVWIRRLNVMFGKTLQATGSRDDCLPRFFRRGALQWTTAPHGCPAWQQNGHLRLDPETYMVHEAWTDVTRFIEKMNRYTSEDAEYFVQQGEGFSVGRLLREPVSEFFQRFIRGEGYKDGTHGLMVSLLFAIYKMTFVIKEWELRGYPVQADQGVERSGKWVDRIWRLLRPFRRVLPKRLLRRMRR